MNIEINKLKIGEKCIYIFEDHATALIPWGNLRNELDYVPNLITLDHHTDVYEAFKRYIYNKDDTKDEGLRKKLIKKINFTQSNTLYDAVTILNHDEQIDAAVKSGIIKYAFCINYSNDLGDKNFGAYNESGIFEIPFECYIGCNKIPHDDNCQNEHYNQAIESIYLNDQLHRMNSILKTVNIDNIENEPYIFDIDLDYFHSIRSINPVNTETFYRLISNSLAVTIAIESECVDEGKINGEDINSSYLLKHLFQHIETALKV